MTYFDFLRLMQRTPHDSGDILRQLEALAERDRHRDDLFRFYPLSKRRERLLRTFWAMKRREATA